MKLITTPMNIKNRQLPIVLLVCFIAGIATSSAQKRRHVFALGDTAFLLDGKPLQMISGEMHCYRIPREDWRDRMKMAKAMGLNTIGTYVFWDEHEAEKGKYDFSGNNDIAEFVRIAKEESLWVVLNILMVQIENEYGSYNNDKSYLDLNRKIFRDAGFDGVLFTCDGADKLGNGYLPGYLPAVNGLENPEAAKKLINRYHYGKGPYYIAEWYPGWFDNWGERHANIGSKRASETLDKILTAGISINMYVFHGGTTRGFMNGANMNISEPYAPQVSSYDYDAPLDEAGNATDKYMRFREIIQKHLPAGQTLPDVPEKKKSIAFQVKLSAYAGLFNNLPKPVEAKTPFCFEDINQAYGFVLYRTTLSGKESGWLKIKEMRDYAEVYINGKKITALDRRLKQDSVTLDNVPAGAVLDILVENNGRINYGPFLTDNRQGITQKVSLNGQELYDWKMYRFPFLNLNHLEYADQPLTGQPVLYKGTFTLTDLGDTYLDMRTFGKGFVFLNARNLGKYWQIGPQQTIYVPASWLKKGENEVVVFDELKENAPSLRICTESF